MQFLFEQDQLYTLATVADEPKMIYIASDALLDADMVIEVIIAQEREPDYGDIEEWDVDDELEDDDEDNEDDELEDDDEDNDEHLESDPDLEPMQTSLRICVIAMIKNKAFNFPLAMQEGNPISPLYVYGIVRQFLDRFERCQVHERSQLMEAVSIVTISASDYLKKGESKEAGAFTQITKNKIEDMQKYRNDKKARRR